MTALAFDDRYQKTTPALSTDPQNVDFEIFSTTDLTVYVDGVETTDFTVSATFTDGVSSNAVVTITTPVVTSPTVEIVGARDPRRDQFLVAAGEGLVTALNADLARRAAEIMEVFRDVGRAVKAPYGETLNNALPSNTARANSYLFFDAAGEPSSVSSAPPTTRGEYATKAALEADSVSASITIVFLSGFTTDGDGGASYWKRVGSEPSHNLKIQSADLAWWEIHPWNNIVPFQACGGIEGDSAANGAANVTAFNNFIGYAQAYFALGVTADGPTLQFPKGNFHFNNHLNVKAAVHIVGAGTWSEGARTGTRLIWAADKSGFIIQMHDTIDDTTAASTFEGRFSIIEGLHLIGNGNADTTGYGVWMRGAAVVRDCFITEFGLDGIHINSHVGAGGATEGNANLWRVEGCLLKRNGRHGLYVDNNDSNAGYAKLVDASLNARWGIYDSSLLCNTYIACHTQQNGVANIAGNAADESSFVSFGSNRYAARRAATEAQLVATTPGTDESIWGLVRSGGVGSNIPLWTAAKPEGTYFHGGSYHAEDAGNRSVFVGCYVENDQGPPQIQAPSMITGGTMDQNLGTGYTLIGGSSKVQISGRQQHINDKTWPTTTTRDISLMINDGVNEPIGVDVDGAGLLSLLSWLDGTKMYAPFQHGGSIRPLQITSSLSTETAGRASALAAGELLFPNGIFIGDNNTNSRHMTNGTAAPASGEHARGEIVWNRTPTASGHEIGWVCITAGTPGTWVEIRGLGNQTSGADQAALTNSTGGTGDGTLAAISGSGADADLNNNFTELHTLLDEVRTTLVSFGLMKGGA